MTYYLGSSEDDQLRSGLGLDVLNAGSGNDVLVGGDEAIPSTTVRGLGWC